MKITDHVDRLDIREKLNGSLKYIEDMHFEDLHYARTLRSTIAKGQIKCINYPPLPEDLYIVDSKDIKDKNEVAMILKDMPIFADNFVNYIGEPIALIVGKDKNRIIEYFNQITVEYAELEPVLSMEESYGPNRSFTDLCFEKGDLPVEYDEMLERAYHTGYQEQLYMEKQGMVGTFSDGVVTVYGSLQCPYYVHNAMKHALGMDDQHVRVVQAPTGGAFGGKEEYPSLLALQVACAAMKVKKPVRLIFDRREDIAYTTKRHPSKTLIKTYLKDNQIVGMDFDIELDSGPYLGLSDVVLQRAMFTLTGCYDFPYVKVRGKTIKTNNVFTGAFRGFGAPQTMYALEHHMNQLSRKLSVDPLEFRGKYFVKKGDITSTGGFFNEDIFLDEMIEKLKAMVEFKDSSKKVGYGYSVIPHGGGFTGDGEATHIKAVVKLAKEENDDVMIYVSNVEMGQGAITALSKIVASAMDIEISKVSYHVPDTFHVPDSGPTVASRTTMVVGGLLYKAAIKLKETLGNGQYEEVFEHFKQPDYVKWNQEKLQGNAYMAYSWSAIMARVEVDPITFDVACTDIYGVYDVGVPIDERLLLGQIHGGVVQGMGYGLMEYMTSEDGLIQHNSFSSYVIPTTSDIPKIHSDWIINRYVDGPFGAKAVGELTLVGVAPAVASAIEDAMAIETFEIPVTPEKIAEAIYED